MNIMKFRPLFFIISLFLIITSVFSIVRWGFKSSIDFAGGSVLQLKFTKSVDSDQIKSSFQKSNLEVTSISIVDSTAQLKFKYISQAEKQLLDEKLKQLDPSYQEVRYETLGPSLGKELLKKTIVAIILSAISLLLFIGSRFKDYTFGASAVIAMFHDAFILIGAFSLFGHYFGAELDSLFVTALLTTLSASVHDTVVTFDRIRELKRKNFKIEWVNLANQAVSEVIIRSINNSMTIIFMLLALVVLGGETTRWFAMALLVGVVCGTYYSTAVAIPIVLYLKKKKA